MTFKYKYRVREKLSALIIIAVLLVAILGNVSRVAAGSITNIWAMETNMATSGAGQLFVAFKVASSVSTPTMTFLMTGSTVATTNGNLVPETTVTGTPSTSCTQIFSYIPSIAAYPGTLNATGSSATITLTTTGNVVAGTPYCVVFAGASAITNPAAAGIDNITISDTTDSGSGYYVVLSSPANTYNVTASVAQTFTLTVAGGPDALGALSASTVIYSSSPITATVGSNAANGVSLFAYDNHQGLYSTSKSYTIASLNPNNASLQTLSANPATPGFITDVNAGSYTSGVALSIPTAFNGSTGSASSTGDGLSAIPAVIAYTSAPTNGATAKLYDAAAINATTPEASDYTDTVTVVGTGSF
jgi:hypothetical protein